MITETLMILMRRSMHEASGLKLQFVPEHLYFSRFLGTPFFFWAWRSPAEDNALKRPDHGHSKRSWRAEVHRRTAAGIYRLT